MPKNDVAGSMLIVIDAHTMRNNLQILDPPVARIPPHVGNQFCRVRHNYMVSLAVPLTGRYDFWIRDLAPKFGMGCAAERRGAFEFRCRRALAGTKCFP